LATVETAVPTALLDLVIPLAAAALFLLVSVNVTSLLSAIPMPWLVAAQVYRIGGDIFLVLMADGRCPGNSLRSLAVLGSLWGRRRRTAAVGQSWLVFFLGSLPSS